MHTGTPSANGLEGRVTKIVIGGGRTKMHRDETHIDEPERKSTLEWVIFMLSKGLMYKKQK